MTDWDLIKRKLEGTTTSADEAKLQQWLVQDASNRVLLEILQERWQKDYKDNNAKKTHDAYLLLSKRISRKSKASQSIPPIFTIKHFLAVAASLLLLLLAGGYYYMSDLSESQVKLITKTTKNNQRASIVLPDGTKVRLNTLSSISYPETFDTESRMVQLTGEAFFEVTKDPQRPFTISSGAIHTTVLGTSFNLRAYENENPDVTVLEGKVSVAAHGHSETLVKGEQACYNVQFSELTKRAVNVDDYLGWTHPSFNFELITFEEVIRQLGRWYHLDITTTGTFDSNCLIRGKYKNEGIVPILSGLQNIVSFQYEIKGERQLIINNHGCINL